MRRNYFASFQLGARGDAPALDDVLGDCARWVRKPRPGITEERLDEVSFSQSEAYDFGGAASLTVLRHDDDSHDLACLRLQHPDAQHDNRCWRTDIALTHDRAEQTLRFTISTAAGISTSQFSPIRVPASRPTLVLDLLRRYGAFEGRPLEATHARLTSDGTTAFLEFLFDPDRQIPIVYCSASARDDQPLDGVRHVADRLAGLAHVFVAANRFPSLRLSNEVGKDLSCWDGAVRIYWPGFSLQDHPFTHPRLLPNRIRDLQERSGKGLAIEILDRVSAVAVARQPYPLSDWDSIQAHVHLARREQLKETGEQSEYVELLEKTNLDLTKRTAELSQALEEAQAAIETEKLKAEQWREAYVDAKRRSTGETPSEDEVENAPPASVADAIERIQGEYPKEIAFKLNSKSDEKSPYQDPSAFYKALNFLATTYRDSRRGERSCSDFDHTCREACGFSYSGHQSAITMGQYASDYETIWNGKTHQLKEHIGQGSSKDPRETVRIAFFYDSNSETVVVGFVGQHQRTSAT